MKGRSAVLAAALLVVATGCAGVRPADAFSDVQRLTAERLAQRVHWRLDTAEDAAVEAAIDALLAAPLTADAAVQVALLENRRLQLQYERLGVAQAELVQAGLLRNPVFVGTARAADGSSSGTNVELSLVQDFLDLLIRPARRELARTQLVEAQLAVAGEVIAFAAQVRSAYYMALGTEQVTVMRKLVVDAAQASADLAYRLHEAGNLSDLQLTNELGLYETARVAWARADAERLAAREELSRAMGVWGARTAWTLPPRLPDLPAEEPPLDELEARAVSRRLDLAAARKEAEALAHALGVTRDWRFLAVAELGVSAEREPDGAWVTGPELALELPLFDRRQAELARLASELRRADHNVFALAVEVRSEVRAARDRLIALRRLAEHYRDVVIPLREAAVKYTQEEHDFMLIGAFELIAAKQAEYDAYQEYMEAVRDYWSARAELERALGGGLPGGEAVEADPPPAPAPERPTEHRHHHGGGS